MAGSLMQTLFGGVHCISPLSLVSSLSRIFVGRVLRSRSVATVNVQSVLWVVLRTSVFVLLVPRRANRVPMPLRYKRRRRLWKIYVPALWFLRWIFWRFTCFLTFHWRGPRGYCIYCDKALFLGPPRPRSYRAQLAGERECGVPVSGPRRWFRGDSAMFEEGNEGPYAIIGVYPR